LPVSSLLTKYRGLDDVCLSVPAIVNRRGVEYPLPVPLSAEEEQGLKKSAEAIRSVVRRLGFWEERRVVLDTLAAHKIDGVRQLVESCGAQLLYLPP
jgi:hypothetical protein